MFISREENTMIESKIRSFTAWRVFFTKVCIFLPMVFIMMFTTTLCFYDFWKIKSCMGVIYFLVCVRKHESNLPTTICTTVGTKTEWYAEKCNLLRETTFLLYFMTAWCVFFYQSVCVFTNGVLLCFSWQHYVSMIFVKQC